ncbi:hypothetical protein KBB96_10915 [Luteolibacter ambystomatis]|uniref:Uncharacterized protein n=1 Tax=Luteolibacter ambystomatis TaxID=2824561 RepID=A0A975IXN8_9BACT|nr:hypothetical protein [Luteolibacter ambystomatis]QUE49382.1 hypothetical protein KBB96_10915 [Luteolibacter ambystomatis]
MDPNRAVSRRPKPVDSDMRNNYMRADPGESGSKDAKDCEVLVPAERFSRQAIEATCANDVPSPEKIKWQLDQVSRALDTAERHAAEWGHASISSAVLVKGDMNRFGVGADVNYATVEGRIRTSQQGAASRLAEKSLGVKLEGEFGVDAIKKTEDEIYQTSKQNELLQQKLELKKSLLQLKKKQTELDKLDNADAGTVPLDSAAEDVPAGNTLPVPTRPDTTGVLPELPTPTAVSNNTNLTINGATTVAAQGLPSGIPPQPGAPDLATLALVADHLQLSEGDIAKQAASTVVTQKLMNYITSPIDGGSNSIPWFVVTQVSVSPGSRTGSDYIAETTLHPYYAKLDSNGCVAADWNPNRPHPTILAAFPLVEAQALDLRNSDRFETRFSLALAAKLIAEGKQAQAKFFLEKMTKIQQDIATRTLLPVVVPNSNGREVTYRFDPGLQGLVEPGNARKGSGLVLNATSVPALLVIMTDRKSLKDRNYLHFELGTRWIPKKQANIWSTTWNGITRNYNPRRGMAPSDVVEAAQGLDVARFHLGVVDTWLKSYPNRIAPGGDFGLALSQARSRLSGLEPKLGSSNSYVAFPSLYNITPSVLVNSRGEEQNIVINSFCVTEDAYKLGNLESISIGGYEFGKKIQAPALAALKADEQTLADAALLKGRSLRPYLSAPLVAGLDSGSRTVQMETLRRIPSERETILMNMDAARDKADEDKRIAQTNYNLQLEAKNRALRVKQDVRKEVDKADAVLKSLKKPAAGILEQNAGNPEVKRYNEAKENWDQKQVDAVNADKDAEIQVQRLAAQYVEVSQANQTANVIAAGPQVITEIVRKNADVEAKQKELALFGKLISAGENATLRFDPDRLRSLPAGSYSVIGNFKGPCSTVNGEKVHEILSRDLGKIEIKDPAPVAIDSYGDNVIPAKFPEGGKKMSVTGKGFGRVKRAMLDSSLADVIITSATDDMLQLLIRSAPSKDDKFILLSDSGGVWDPNAKNHPEVVGYVKIQSEPKPALSVTTSQPVQVAFDEPKVVLAGVFPDGIELYVQRQGKELEKVSSFKRMDKSLEYTIPNPVEDEAVKLVVKPGTANGSDQSVNVKVGKKLKLKFKELAFFPPSFDGPLTNDMSLKLLLADLDPSLKGKPVDVNIGGVTLQSEKLDDSGAIVVKGFSALKATGNLKVMVLVDNEIYTPASPLTVNAAKQ